MKWLIVIIALLLSLAPLMAQPTSHIMKPGETLYSLARQYGVSLNALLASNNITNVQAVPSGTVLVIPSSNSSNISISSTPPLPAATASYKVIKGDTYYSIARRYGISVDQLLALSHRTLNDALKVGDLLTVPSSTPSSPPQVVVQPTQPVAPPAIITLPAARPSDLAIIDGLTWPVNGIISQHEGRQRGVKITINGEQSIKALSRGTVVFKGNYRELGQIVVVEHLGGYTYLYSGFDNAYVKIGDQVEAGTSLGRGGANNNIIFSVFKEGNPIDPKIAPRD